MKKILLMTLALMICLSSNAFAVLSSETNTDVLDHLKSLYGLTNSGADVQLIGTNTDGDVSIDSGATGAVFGGAVSISGATGVESLTIDDFIVIDPATTVSTNATTNATITALGTNQPIDTWASHTVTTVNNVATANMANGTEISFSTINSGRDAIFIETGNLNLGGTRTLSDPADVLIIRKYDTDDWKEVGFYDNN